MTKHLIAFAVCGVILSMPSQSDAQINLRAGVSSVSGLAGVEYQAGNLAGAIGFLRGDKLRLPVSVRYLVNAEGSSLWGAVSFISNNDNGGVITSGSIEDEYYHTVGLTVGYRKSMGEALDLSVGLGYGTHIGVSDGAISGVLNDDGTWEEAATGVPLIDISIGYHF